MVPVPAFPKVFGACRTYEVVSNHLSGERLSDGRLPSNNALGRGADEPVLETSTDSLIVSGRPVRSVVTPEITQPPATRSRARGAADSNRRPCPNGKS